MLSEIHQNQSLSRKKLFEKFESEELANQQKNNFDVSSSRSEANFKLRPQMALNYTQGSSGNKNVAMVPKALNKSGSF